MESGINRSALINCLVGKCPFSALKGHHHERSIKRLAASSFIGALTNSVDVPTV